ncbi:unnamed protein product [Prorocentrum cordatum]|uniref:N-acetyltransferase domain-containing protein n=1 Tax=Prorocentrum cordatum TaxID=2364126 RepID=A0ABN9U0U8_9DINO|nr:unnamed protein product [Polarella glacialis]
MRRGTELLLPVGPMGVLLVVRSHGSPRGLLDLVGLRAAPALLTCGGVFVCAASLLLLREASAAAVPPAEHPLCHWLPALHRLLSSASSHRRSEQLEARAGSATAQGGLAQWFLAPLLGLLRSRRRRLSAGSCRESDSAAAASSGDGPSDGLDLRTEVGSLRLARKEPPFPDPCPVAVASSLRAWIQDARRESRAPSAAGRPQRQHEQRPGKEELQQLGKQFLFGALSISREELPSETVQVFVHRKRMLAHKERFILLHFYSNNLTEGKPKGKECGFLYFEAASGTLHGFHIGSEHRGRGLVKLMLTYYVLFCREFDLPALDTSRNKKPIFAKLYHDMGYEPLCIDFPFLFFSGRMSSKVTGGQAIEGSNLASHWVLPLPPVDPAWASASKRKEGTQWEGNTLWNISRQSARSQGFEILDAPHEFAAEGLSECDGLKLYAKTSWRLQDTRALRRRESFLERASRRGTCIMYWRESKKERVANGCGIRGATLYGC